MLTLNQTRLGSVYRSPYRFSLRWLSLRVSLESCIIAVRHSQLRAHFALQGRLIVGQFCYDTDARMGQSDGRLSNIPVPHVHGKCH